MIKALILYYLSLKATHGYEIQKFIQVNHLDSYTKIQSGSIYYALSKLEKEGLIELYKEEQIGAKTRKIYSITDKGREELSSCLEEEIKQEIYPTGSDKFIIYAILNGMDKDSVVTKVNEHMDNLREKKREIEKWQKLKINEETLKVESICFEMMLSSLDYQMKWHKALLDELDLCMQYSEQAADVIRTVDFSDIEDNSKTAPNVERCEIERLKKEILTHPNQAEKKLEELIRLMNSKGNK